MSKLLLEKQNKILSDLLCFYQNVLNYFAKYFDIDGSSLKRYLNLLWNQSSSLQFHDLKCAAQVFSIDYIINLDEMYEEFCTLKQYLTEEENTMPLTDG